MSLWKLHEIKIRLDRGAFYSETLVKFFKMKHKILKNITQLKYAEMVEVFDKFS